MTATFEPVALSLEEAERDARQQAAFERRAAEYDARGESWRAEQIRAQNTPERRAYHRAELDRLRWQQTEPDWEARAEEAAEQADNGRGAWAEAHGVDPWGDAA